MYFPIGCLFVVIPLQKLQSLVNKKKSREPGFCLGTIENAGTRCQHDVFGSLGDMHQEQGLKGVCCTKVLITWVNRTNEYRRNLLNVQRAHRILS
jgi:hypothetical protein